MPLIADRLLPLLVAIVILMAPACPPVWAGPVEWHEVPATVDGRQWWDSGSLRFSRGGYLTVLSRFQPASPAPAPSGAAAGTEPPERPAPSTLYVMEIDCDESLYRDRSVNGFHQFSPQWQPVVADDLIGEVIVEACAAGSARIQAGEGRGV
ncbi:MAG: hypothetical protein ACKOCM_04255 [Cyanobacteriota bacterium]